MNNISKFILTIFILLFLSSFDGIAGVRKIKLSEDDRINQIQVNNIDENGFEVRCSVGELMQGDISVEGGEFCEIALDGFSFSTEIGSPKLPVITKIIEVPVDCEFQVEVVFSAQDKYDLEDLGINKAISPKQQSVSKANNEVKYQFDQEIYNQNSFLSGIQVNEVWDNPIVSVKYLGVMRDKALALITISPIQYNPIARSIRVYEELLLDVKFVNEDQKATQRIKSMGRSVISSEQNSIISNPSLLPKKAGKGEGDSLVEVPYKYLIVTDSMFAESLIPFVKWKTKKGFDVEVKFVEESTESGEYNTIRDYIKSLYDNASVNNPFPTYILLAGDDQVIATRYPATKEYAGTDLWYAEFTDDYLPEAYYGRFPASTVEDMDAIIEKTLIYEQYLFNDPSYLDRTLFVAGIESGEGETHGNGQLNYALGNYFDVSKGFINSAYYYPESGTSANQIIQDLSNGVGFANYTGHGLVDGWQDPAFRITDIDGLLNEGKYPVMVGNACITLKFYEQNSFGELIVVAKDKGAVGYIGASEDTFWDEDFYWAMGYGTISENQTYAGSDLGMYDRLFHSNGESFEDWQVSMSQMIFAGNMAVTASGSPDYKLYWEIYHLMGDPSLIPYLGQPDPIIAQYNPIIPLGTDAFEIQTEPYAYVAITRNDTIFGVGFTDENGSVTVKLNPFTSGGYADIVITAQNKQPYIESIIVDTPDDAYVVYFDHEVNDSLGNNNSLVDITDTISLDFELINVGNQPALELVVVLSSVDTLVEITDKTVLVDSIGKSEKRILDNSFLITFNPRTPNGHWAKFEVVCADSSENSWVSSFELAVNAPDLEIVDLLIRDDAIVYNGNNKLDPAEIDTLIISIRNNGAMDILSPVLSFRFDSLEIAVLDTLVMPDSFPVGQVQQLIFLVEAYSSVDPGTNSIAHIFIEELGYIGEMEIVIPIGTLVQDFESGFITDSICWSVSGNGAGEWKLSGENPYEGAYCMKAQGVEDKTSANLIVKYNAVVDDSISFYYKVSSELTFDYLNFYIDNDIIGEWSGEVGWSRASYAVGKGNHIFTWSYSKDRNSSIGDDCSWLDYITFPPVEQYIINGITVNENEVSVKALDWKVYPNPFIDYTNISYALDEESSVNIMVYNYQGVLVDVVLEDQHQNAGSYDVLIDCSRYSKGMYLCVIRTDGQIQSKKILRSN